MSALTGPAPRQSFEQLMSSPQLRAALRRGVASEGEPSRLLRVLRDAEAGRALTLVGIGASLTQDFGGVIGRDHDRHALEYMGKTALCRGACVQSGWLTQLAEHLAGEVPLAESNVSVVNVGHAGNMLSSYVHCTNSLIPRTGDLYILDAATILGPIADAERVIRWVLDLPQRPAMLLLHLYDFCGNRGNDVLRKACYRPRMQVQRFVSQSEMERNLGDLTAYYALPAVSFRRAFFQHAVMAGQATSSVTSGAVSHLFSPQKMTLDGLHPREMGLGDGMGRLITALLASFLTDLRVRYRVAPLVTGEPLPCLPFSAGVSLRSHEERCFAVTLPRTAEEEQLTKIGKIWQPTDIRRPLAPAVGTVGFRFAQVRNPVLVLVLPHALDLRRGGRVAHAV